MWTNDPLKHFTKYAIENGHIYNSKHTSCIQLRYIYGTLKERLMLLPHITEHALHTSPDKNYFNYNQSHLRRNQ